MRDAFYRLLGYFVWKGFVADLRRRCRTAAKGAGVGALVLVAVVAVVVLVQRRDGEHA